MESLLRLITEHSKIIVVYNGSPAPLGQSSEFRAALELLAQCPASPVLLVAARRFYDQVTPIVGDVESLGWRVATHETVAEWPSQLVLVKTGDIYSGYTFEQGDNTAQEVDSHEAEFIWCEFDEMVTESLETAGA